MSWRSSSRDEVFQFYTSEFPDYIADIPDHITPGGPKQYAIAFQDKHPVKSDRPDRDFIRRYPRGRGGEKSQRFRDWDDLLAFIKAPAENDPLRSENSGLADPALVEKPAPLPHSVYYSLDHWDRDWVLAVDIDAKDIAKARAERTFGDHFDSTEDLLEQSGVLPGDPEGFPYQFKDVEQTIEYGFQTKEIFETQFGADATMVVYSGQGVHVYLLDDDPEHDYDEKSREVINDLLQDKFGIPIDPVVTADRKRVIRLPYSLHSDVSRVVCPIQSPDFDPRTDARPDFLGPSTEGEIQ
jgi:DNA primase catalytic subunit